MTDEDPTPIVIPDSDDELLAECRVETFRAGGKGGQHQNTTDSGVRLVHLPTGTRVVARSERSQHRNRMAALARLRTKLEKLNERPAERVPTRVPKRQKAKRLKDKRKRSEVKRRRRPPKPDREE